MKIIVICLCLLMLSFINIEAQTTQYFKIYGTDCFDEGCILNRTCDNGFILASRSKKYDNSADALITKIDSAGNLKWQWNIGFSGTYDDPISVIETNDSNIIIFIGSYETNVKMRIAAFNYAGNLLFDKHDYYLSDGFPDFSIKSASLLPDGRIVTPVVVSDSIFKAYWWSQTGDTLFSATIDTCKQFQFSTHEIYSTNLFIDNDTLVFYLNNYFSSSIDAETIIKTDFNGVVLDEKSHINGLGVSAPSATFIKNNRFVFTQIGTISNLVLCFLYDYLNDSIYKTITYSNPGYQISCQSLSTSSDTVYLLCGLTYNNLDSMSSYILKSDSSGNMLWLRKYKPYGYDHSNLMQVFHYEDCIAAIGYAYNSTASSVSDSYDILFVKADLNGNATSITTFEKPDNTLTVFPNPASDLINVNLLPVGESVYTIVYAGGRELLKGKTPGNQISISSLPAGCYQLLWENDGKKYHAGFVKE